MEDDLNSQDTNEITPIGADEPEFLKGLKPRSGKLAFDVDIPFTPENSYAINTSADSLVDTNHFPGIKESSSFTGTVAAEYRNLNTPYHVLHASYNKLMQENPLYDIPPPNWTPKSDVEKFVNVSEEYYPYLFDATGPKDQDYRLQRIFQEQKDKETLENGSTLAKLIGGAAAVFSDPTNLIPIVGWAKYSKLSPSIIKTAARSFPGILAQSTLHSAAEQMDRINGNLPDFLIDSFTSSVFSAALFGAAGGVAHVVEKMNLWKAKNFVNTTIKGIDYKFTENSKGIIDGMKAIDTTGSLSAAEVSFAQDYANSSFNKSGIFKIPYVGAGILKLASSPIIGSPLPRLLNSSLQATRGIIDRIASNSIISKGVAEGGEAPKRFEDYMQQTHAKVRAMGAQMTSLHLERNGLKTTNRTVDRLKNIGLYLKQTGLEALSSDMEKSGYVSQEDFFEEVQTALRTGEPSEHAAVNTAYTMFRKHLDDTYTAYREAHNLPKDWLPPKTADEYLMRVYNTPYMNTNQTKWVGAISNWLKEADDTISQRMKPINDINDEIKLHTENHKSLIGRPNITDNEVKASSDKLIAMRARKTSLEETLQNDIRANPDLHIHMEDWNALSANEAKTINQLTKKRDVALKEVNERKKVVADIKAHMQKREAAAMKSKTAQTAKSNTRKKDTGALVLQKEEAELAKVQHEYEEELEALQLKMHNNEIPSNLYFKQKDSFIYELKDPNNRLRLRDTYSSHAAREQHALANYNTILNQRPEDTINQIMGRFTGNASENHLKERTLLIPDEVLYKNNFMTKDLMAKVANYTSYLDRRTHLKNVFRDVTVDGGFEPVLEDLSKEATQNATRLDNIKAERQKSLENPDLSEKERKSLQKDVTKIDKQLVKNRKAFESDKKDLNFLYEKMMGINRATAGQQMAAKAIMAVTSGINLAFVPFTMINDISAIGLQHGIWPFIRDGVAPIIESFGGIRKTADSEALRKAAPSLHLALQDVLSSYEHRNWSKYTNPYFNMGKIVDTMEYLAHASTNFTGTNYIDNGLQHITAGVVQSELMRIMHAFKAGTMTEREGIYARNYGLDPAKWHERMIKAFQESGGGKTKLGGYNSRFWEWKDLEASNELGSAVFRGVKDTQIQSGIADSPFWYDINGPMGVMGPIIKGFKGWVFASVNRYVIPSMQTADAQKMIGVMFMLATGAMVSPLRRMARGLDPYDDKATPQKIMYQTFQDSGYFSYFFDVLSDANLLTGDRLLGDLKNDRYRDRARVGLLGPTVGNANSMADIITAMASGELNENDAKQMARMIPFANASWTAWMSAKLIESLGLPKTRAQARAANH